jgi:hypothetical protein
LAFKTEEHQARLYNVTDASVAAYGSMQHSNNEEWTSDQSSGDAYLDLATAKTFRLEHRCDITGSMSFYSASWGAYSVAGGVTCLRTGD